jgi:predicted dehydrogenase
MNSEVNLRKKEPQGIYKVGLIGNGYGYKVLLPVLKSINVLETTFALPQKYSTEQYKNYMNLGVKISNVADILDSEDIKLIFVAVPPNAQLEISKEVLLKSKTLYCEKPVGISFHEADILQRLSHDVKKNSYVGFQFRFDPGIVALKELLQIKQLGTILSTQIDWHTTGTSAINDQFNWRNDINIGGGVHRDFLCHVVDYLKWITCGSFSISLESLFIDTNFNSNLSDIKLRSLNSNPALIKINISRGKTPISYWEIKITFDSGEICLRSTYPFSLKNYKTVVSGSKDFCSIVGEFINDKKYLNGTTSVMSAREYALQAYFDKIIDNVFQNGKNTLPTLEDAKFTQRISDSIQTSL